jgi:Rieske 2Fe-2S family protein
MNYTRHESAGGGQSHLGNPEEIRHRRPYDLADLGGTVNTPLSPDRRQLIPTLERSWYTDPAAFDAEQRFIWARRWILAGRSSDIVEPGAYLTLQVGGESVILVRQEDGAASALLNVCRHRGARIFLDEQGTCRGAIRCPYHAWTYGFDGALRAAPNIRDWVGDDRDQLGLQRVRVQERYGCLWINLDDSAASFDDDIGAQIRQRLGREDIEGWGLDRLVTGRRIVYDVAANWKLLVENFMECYHCASIHPELVNVIPEFRKGLGTQSHGPGYGASLGDGIDGFTFDGRAGLAPLSHLDEDDRRRYFGITVTPSAFINLFGDHAIIHRLEPVAVDRTRLVCDWLFEPATLAGDVDIAPSVELFDRVNRQDFDACERCQLGATSRIYSHESVLVPLEHHLEGFYNEVREALASE